MKAVLSTLVLAGLASLADAHMRLQCPQPRDWNNLNTGFHDPSANTGNKAGPCGPFSDQMYWGKGGVTELVPNSWVTITTQESIYHAGAPWRLAILDETLQPITMLLDHIPHWDAEPRPTYGTESSYPPSRVNVYIPDLQCLKCSLQAISFMTNGFNCTYPGGCGAYHSCADIVINGKVPPSKAGGMFEQPMTWPNRDMPTGAYGVEVGNYNNGWLADVPPEFNTPIPGGMDVCTPAAAPQ